MLEFRRGRPPPEAACTWPRRTAKDRRAAPGSPKRGGTARCPTSSPLGIREDRNFLACRGTARHPRGISWILIFKFEFQFSISKNSGGRPRSVQDFLKSSKKIQKILKLLPSGPWPSSGRPRLRGLLGLLRAARAARAASAAALGPISVVLVVLVGIRWAPWPKALSRTPARRTGGFFTTREQNFISHPFVPRIACGFQLALARPHSAALP